MRYCLLVPLLIVASSRASSQELSAAVHARLFEPSKQVTLRTPVVRIPMRGTDHDGNAKCPYFQVYVNGSGPFTFLFDTGAAYAVVSSKVVQAAAAPIIVDRTRRDVISLDRLQLGGVTVRGLWAIEDDTFGVDGIIGFPTLGKSNILFDLSRRELLVSNKRIPMRRRFALPYEAPFNVPTVPVQIGGHTVPLLLDTGDDAYGLEVRSSELGDAPLESPPIAAATVKNGAVQQATRIARLKDPVRLGPLKAYWAEIAINDGLPVGDFGYDVLRKFRFQIDPTRQRVEFEPLFEGDRFSIATKGPGR